MARSQGICTEPGVTKKEKGQYQSDRHVEHEKLFWKSQMAQLKVLQAYCFHTERLLNNSTSKVFRVVESFSVSVELCKLLYVELCYDIQMVKTENYTITEYSAPLYSFSAAFTIWNELGVNTLTILGLCNITCIILPYSQWWNEAQERRQCATSAHGFHIYTMPLYFSIRTPSLIQGNPKIKCRKIRQQ